MKNKMVTIALVLSAIVIISAAGLYIANLEETEEKTTPTNDETGVKEKEFYYSFEDSMQGWDKDGTDLDHPPINWTIEHTDELSYNSTKSIKLYLDNMNDAGKIWMIKQFNLTENTQYEVTVSYKFATRDYGIFNLFNIITGADPEMPQEAGDLTFQGDTGHGQEEDIGYIWLNKSYDLIQMTDEDGVLYVTIGVWGNWETPRTYYIDNVNISFDEIEPEELPNVNGEWKITYYNWENNVTDIENVTVTKEDYTVTIFNESGNILCQGMLGKNTRELPYNQAEYIITDCNFSKLGVNTIYVRNETYMKTEMPLVEYSNPAVITKK